MNSNSLSVRLFVFLYRHLEFIMLCLIEFSALQVLSCAGKSQTLDSFFVFGLKKVSYIRYTFTMEREIW